jgi:hypothetical protein
MGRWKRGDLIGPAKLFLATLVDKALHKQVSARVVLDPNNRFTPYYFPSSLLAAIWLQIYSLVIGKTKFRRCEVCLERMDVTENRTHKRVHLSCSRKLRMRRYRSKE